MEIIGMALAVVGTILLPLVPIFGLLVLFNVKGIRDRLYARYTNIPGFRSQTRWKATLAATGYLLIVTLAILTVAGVLLPPFEDPDNISGIDIDQQTVKVGDSVEVAALITNGANDTETISVNFEVNGETVSSKDVTLDSDETREIPFTRTFDDPGDHQVSINGQDAGTVTVEPIPSPTPTATPSPTPTTTPSPTPTSTPTPSEEERMRQAITNAEYGSFSIHDDEIREVNIKDDTIVIWIRPDSYFDGVDIARTGTQNSYVAARALYTEFDNVEMVTVYSEAEFTDQYGNTNHETAVMVNVSHETSQEINWEGMYDLTLSDYKNYLQVSDSYGIHLAVCSELNELYPNCGDFERTGS